MTELNLSERRIILLGKTGNGKSSTGNSILRKQAFRHELSPNPVTEKCTLKTGTIASYDILYILVDTPGLFDTKKHVGERALDILQSVEICDNPHVFLLVFSAKNRMTEEERYTIDMLRIIFGENVFKHAIVVFTHGEMFESEEMFKKFSTQNEKFVELIKKCGNRAVRIDNKSEYFDYNEGAEKILHMIEELTDGGRICYRYKHIETHRSVLEEHIRNYQGTGSTVEDMSDIVKKLGKKLDRRIWKTMLFGGLLVGGSAMSIGYLAGAAGANAVVVSGLGATMVSNAAAVGGAVVRTAGSVATAAASSNVGSMVLNNGAAIGGAVVQTAWNVATKIRFW